MFLFQHLSHVCIQVCKGNPHSGAHHKLEHAVAEFRGTVIKLKNAGDLVLWLLLLVITSLPQIMTEIPAADKRMDLSIRVIATVFSI